jgi:hypothetical protein
MSNRVRGRVALLHLQGGIALVDRMRRARTLDRATAEALIEPLAIDPAALWLDRDVRRALDVKPWERMEDALLGALAGTAGRVPPRSIAWGGDQYVLDVAGHERKRVRRFRAQHGGPPIDVPLDLYRVSRTMPEQAGDRALELSDTLLADALLSLAYAADWPDVPGSERIIRNAARRHELGFNLDIVDARTRAAWSLPERTSTAGVGWRLDGAILGLDIGLAPLGLRRVSGDAFMPPALSSTERSMFVESVGLLNPLILDDQTQRAIAHAIARGDERIASLGRHDVDTVIAAIKMDGHRSRALRWALDHDPERVGDYFSMADRLRLGGGETPALDAWGMSARKLHGCLCRIMAPEVGPAALIGRPHVGLLAVTVADLHLRVAVTLDELGLPAALSKPVLAAAAREFVDRAKPSDPDDWLTLARTARALSRDRVEDYLAGATVDGPLVTRR